MEQFWLFITTFGDIRFWLVVFFIAAFYTYYISSGRKKTDFGKNIMLAIAVALILSAVSVYALKIAFSIPRECMPCKNGIEDGLCNRYCFSDSSFPSGHSTTAFAVLGSLWIAIKKHISRRKWLLAAPLIFGFAALISASRLFLEVHTLIDVITGSALGILMMIIYFWIEIRLAAFKNKKRIRIQK